MDYENWNPDTDINLPAHFTPAKMKGKEICKEALQYEYRLPVNPALPVLATVTRITYQKGMDILLPALYNVLSRSNAQYILLGSGDAALLSGYEQLREAFPGRVGIFRGYNERLAHLVDAGADIYCMPSRYEPCGLNQMYSLKYGTIPVVRATGGLDDTVEEWDPQNHTGNGFKFTAQHPEAVAAALQQALACFADREQWRTLRKNAMKFHRSWDDAAPEYETLYERLTGKTRASDSRGG